MRRLVFSGFGKAPATHPLEAGDLCMAAIAAAPGEHHLAKVVDYRKKKVIFFDDGSEAVVDASDLKVATQADRSAAKDRYTAALAEAKAIAALDAEDLILEAIERVELRMGGTLGDDGMITYSAAAGEESQEGKLLMDELIGRFGSLATESPAVAWMSSHWREVCEAADADQSGTISTDEAVEIWDRVSGTISSTVTKKLDLLGAPPRLYRGDLCLALPVESETDASDPSRMLLATFMDSTHVTYFDGGDGVSPIRAGSQILPATAAAREDAILRYSKAVAQCKAAARKPSDQVVKRAIEAVKAGMGGTLGRGNAIDYTVEAGDEAREGQILLQALVANFGALKAESKAVREIEQNWKVACAQADEDQSGTIQFKEAVAIWDRIIIEMTRTFTSKLDRLGVNPLPLVLSPGDLCMARPTNQDSVGHSDPNRLYLATYVDETHATFFDDADGAPKEVAKLGPATASDKDVAVVKYTQALSQCVRLSQYESTELVAEAIAEVKSELGSLGKDGKINYRADAGAEAREGQALCEALVANCGALWDESPSVAYMMSHWQQTCREADADNSGTISEEEAAAIWAKMLQTFMQFVAGKLEALGVANRKPRTSKAGSSEAVQSV